MTPRARLRAAALTILIAGAATAPGAQEGNQAMPDISLRLRLDPADLLDGERIAAEVTATNQSPAPVDLPAGVAAFCCGFSVMSGAEGTRVLSLMAALVDRHYETADPDNAKLVAVAPGASVTLGGDLGFITTAPVPAGTYQMVATMDLAGGAAVSPPAPLVIRPLDVLAIATAPEPAFGGIEHVIIHRAEGGAITLDRRAQSTLPFDGPLDRRAPLPGAADGGASAAVAMPVTRARQPLWTAALIGGRVHVRGSDGLAFAHAMAPLDAPLANARLHPIGWTTGKDAAEFLLLGDGPSGPALAILRSDAIADAIAVEHIALPGGPVAAWRARRAPGAGWFDLFAIGEDGVLRRMRITPGQAAPAATVMAEGLSATAAIALYPIAPEPDPPPQTGRRALRYADPAPVDALDVLSGPIKQGEAPLEMRFRRFALGGGAPMDVSFACPVFVATGETPKAWALSDATDTGPLAAGLIADLLFTVPMDAAPRPRPLARGMADAQFVSLQRSGAASWVQWIDPKGGLRHMRAGGGGH